MAEDGVLRCAPLPSSNLVPFGRCGGTREAGSTGAESLVVLYRVGTHRIRRRRREARLLTSQESAEPLCARIKSANREVFLREKLIADHGLFSSYEGQQGEANGQDSWVFFRDAQGFGRLDAGSCAGFISSRPPSPWISVFRFSIFFLYCTMCDLEKLELVDQNCLEHNNLSALLLRTLAVGRRQQSESIEVALDIMESKEV